MIDCYSAFRARLLTVGFSMLVGSGAGAEFSILTGGWSDAPPNPFIRWHTGDPETDPWEWRIRLLANSGEVAYAKLFFGKAGYVTREWAPRLLAVRGRGRTLEEAYSAGLVSAPAKRIYDIVGGCRGISAYQLRKRINAQGAWDASYERGLVELQMRMDITISGEERPEGRARGWPASVFVSSGIFWGDDVFAEAAAIGAEDASRRIAEQIERYYPHAKQKAAAKFIRG
jgi:hypothetical protein